jgi:hypothetical protein
LEKQQQPHRTTWSRAPLHSPPFWPRSRKVQRWASEQHDTILRYIRSYIHTYHSFQSTMQTYKIYTKLYIVSTA